MKLNKRNIYKKIKRTQKVFKKLDEIGMKVLFPETVIEYFIEKLAKYNKTTIREARRLTMKHLKRHYSIIQYENHRKYFIKNIRNF